MVSGFSRTSFLFDSQIEIDYSIGMPGREAVKAATRTDKPQWLPTPENITTANVCRLSGQRARSACEHVDVMDEKSRRLERRSMVYTEYFVRGTEPTEEWAAHSPAWAPTGTVPATAATGTEAARTSLDSVPDLTRQDPDAGRTGPQHDDVLLRQRPAGDLRRAM